MKLLKRLACMMLATTTIFAMDREGENNVRKPSVDGETSTINRLASTGINTFGDGNDNSLSNSHIFGGWKSANDHTGYLSTTTGDHEDTTVTDLFAPTVSTSVYHLYPEEAATIALLNIINKLDGASQTTVRRVLLDKLNSDSFSCICETVASLPSLIAQEGDEDLVANVITSIPNILVETVKSGNTSSSSWLVTSTGTLMRNISSTDAVIEDGSTTSTMKILDISRYQQLVFELSRVTTELTTREGFSYSTIDLLTVVPEKAVEMLQDTSTEAVNTREIIHTLLTSLGVADHEVVNDLSASVMLSGIHGHSNTPLNTTHEGVVHADTTTHEVVEKEIIEA